MVQGSHIGAGAQTLWSVQWMRAAAALMVVVGHAQGTAAGVAAAGGGSFARSGLLPWGAGVDLFFVISGFIMVHASRGLFGRAGGARTFLRRRLARVVPLYWLATSLYLLLLGAATLKGGDPFPRPGAIAGSFLFLPYGGTGDGLAFPVFDLGWTLNYEMFFYALFALVLATGLSRVPAVLLLAAGLMLLAVAGRAVPGAWTAPAFWTRPVILDFALGLSVGLARAEGLVLGRTVRGVLVLGGAVLLATDPAGVFALPAGVTVANGWPRVLAAGLPAAALLAGAVLGPERAAAPRLAPLSRLGDASYSLYLLHPFVLILLEKLAQKSDAVRGLPGWLLVAAAIAGSIAVALAGFARVERPATRLLVRGTERPRAGTAAAAT